MPLGTFTPPATGVGSSYNPKEKHGRPLIAVPRKFLPNHVSKKYPQPKDKVAVDVVDLLENKVYLSVLWGSGPIVDRLNDAMKKGNTDVPLPVKIREVHPDGGGNVYYTVDPLDGKELELAAAWDAKNPTRIADERAKAEAEANQQQADGQAAGDASSTPDKPLSGLGKQESAPAAESGGAGAGVSDDQLQAMIDGLA